MSTIRDESLRKELNAIIEAGREAAKIATGDDLEAEKFKGIQAARRALAILESDPQRKSALTILRVIKRYAEEHNIAAIVGNVDEVVRLIR
jgi:hypothetical protein